MGFTGMFSVETVLKIIGFGIKVGILENKIKHTQNNNHSKKGKDIDNPEINHKQVL